MSSTTFSRGQGDVMNDHTKLGLYLLFPPIVLWGLMILFMLDSTLGSYVFSRMNLTAMDIIFLIAGFIFPGAALAVGVNGLIKKSDKRVNITVTVVSATMLVLMTVIVFTL